MLNGSTDKFFSQHAFILIDTQIYCPIDATRKKKQNTDVSKYINGYRKRAYGCYKFI